jgi:hypothetical protein
MGWFDSSTFNFIFKYTFLYNFFEFWSRFVYDDNNSFEYPFFLVFKIPKTDRYAKHIEFSPLLNGIGIVFSDGTSGLIICETSKFEPQV